MPRPFRINAATRATTEPAPRHLALLPHRTLPIEPGERVTTDCRGATHQTRPSLSRFVEGYGSLVRFFPKRIGDWGHNLPCGYRVVMTPPR